MINADSSAYLNLGEGVLLYSQYFETASAFSNQVYRTGPSGPYCYEGMSQGLFGAGRG